jgi:alanyl-tRNA synthetase
MHKALREVLGPHVQQKGSLVDANRTRFDFSHNEPMTDEQRRRVETVVNAEILRNETTTARIMKFDEAVKAGAMAFFGDKWGRSAECWITVPPVNCAAAPVQRTGDISFFKCSPRRIAAGVRRIEATTGERARVGAAAGEGGIRTRVRRRVP